MPKVIYEQFDGGLQQGWYSVSETTRAFKNQTKTGILGMCNPFISEGHLVPGIGSRTSVTNEGTITGSQNNIRSIISVDDNVIDTSAKASIYFGQDDDFHAMSLSGIIQTSGWPKTLNMSGAHSAHSAAKIDKIIDYQINGNRRVISFFRDDTDWDAALWDGTTFTTAGLSAASGYSSSMVDKSYPILSVVSDNGYTYFGNKNSLHKFDGTTSGGANGTITGDVLKLSASREMTDIVDGLGKIWVLTRPATTSSAFASSGWPFQANNSQRQISVLVWNRTSTTVAIEDNIIIDGCVDAYALYIHDGIIYAWTKGLTGINQLRAYNGSTFKVVAELGKQKVGIPAVNNAGSIAQYKNGFFWADRESNVFYHGTINPLLSEQHYSSPIYTKSTYFVSRGETSPTGNSGGAITSGCISESSWIFVTNVQSSAVKMQYFQPDSQSETSAGTYVYLPAIEIPKLSTINGITIFFNELSSAYTGTIPVNVYNSWTKTSSEFKKTIYIDADVDIPRGWAYFPLTMENSNLVQLRIDNVSGITLANSPQITRIEVDYTITTKLK